MRYALIGCGRISGNHMRAAVANGWEIVAVCDLKEERMEKVLELCPQRERVVRDTDYHRMLQKISPDIVSIATESGSHARIALDCIARGIHVIIEKPIAMSMVEADEILSCAKKMQVKVCVCHQNRLNVAVQRMRRALEAGRFGRLSHGTVHIRWNRNQEYYAQAPWRGTWEQDGGALMNQCIHGIDLLRWMLGDEIDAVYGVTRQQFHSYLEAEDVGLAVVSFRNGAIATIEGTVNVYPQNLEETLYLFGEHGTVKLGGRSVNQIDVWQFRDELAEDHDSIGFVEPTENVYGNGHMALFADMGRAVREDRTPYVDGEAGRRALELVLAIYKSQREGRPVRFPIGEFGTLDMK